MPVFSFFSWRRRPRSFAEDRLGRIRKVLEHLAVDYPDHDPESALCRLPPAPAPTRSACLKLQPLRLPLKFTGPVALLEGGFELDRKGEHCNVREFSGSDMAALREFAPEAVVTPLDAALFLADRRHRDMFALPSLRTALVVLTRLDDSPLADHHRDLLWRAFGVPIFEQLMGWNGAVIARECEVHDGMHIEQTAAAVHLHGEELLVTQLNPTKTPVVRARTGLTAEIVREHCECGSETPRLRNLNQVRRQAATATAGGRR